MVKIFLFLFIATQSLFSVELTQEQKLYLEQKGTIKLCIDPDWYPFELVTDEGEFIGIAAELIELVQKNLNLNMQIVDTKDWDETLEFSKQRKCDVVGFLNETRQRQEWLTFTKPLLSDPNVLIGRIDGGYIDDLSKIENATAVLLSNTSVYERFVNEFPRLDIITVESEAQAFSMVENRKADFTLRSMIISAHTIREQGLFNLKIIGIPSGYENHLRMGVRNDEPILRDILNKGIDKISDIQRNEIVNRYVTIVIEEQVSYTLAMSIVVGLLAVIGGFFIWNTMLQRKVDKEVEKNMVYEKELMRQKKDAEMGSLMAGISHQWRDGLSDVSSITMNLLTRVDFGVEISKEDIKKSAKEIERSISFMSETMDSFLELYRPEKLTTQVDIKNSIESILVILDAKIKQSNAQIVIHEYEKTICSGVKNYWMQIWLNLIVNSLNAANKQEIKKPKIIIDLNKEMIVYQDNCGGIDEKTLQKINKNATDGLGMKIVDSLIKKVGLSYNITNYESGVMVEISL